MSATAEAPTRARRARRQQPAPTPRPTDPERTDPQPRAHPGRPWSSLPFLIGVSGILAGGLLALLMINNSLAAGSFEQARLKADATLLGEQEQALNQEVERLSSPTRLRQAARDLGLMPAAATAYVDLADGRILGTPLPAGGAYAPAILKQPREPKAENPDGSDGAARIDRPSGTPSRGLSDTEDPTATDSPGADPPGAGDGASVSPPGSAYDRAVVSGEGQ